MNEKVNFRVGGNSGNSGQHQHHVGFSTPTQRVFYPRNNFNSLDHICNLAVKNQEKFYKEIFGININFSSFLNVFEKQDIPPSEYFNKFITNDLTEKIVDKTCLKELFFSINVDDLPWKEKDEENRPNSYILSLPRIISPMGKFISERTEIDNCNNYITFKERKILELYLKFFSNKRLSDYYIHHLICQGTILTNYKKERSSPALIFNTDKYRYYPVTVKEGQKFEQFFSTPIKIIGVR